MPSLFRDDYVTNSNDSYWLSNPEQPLEGFARIIGDERTARSLRTRLGLLIVAGAARRSRQLHAAAAAGRGLQQPPVRRRAVAATSSSRCARRTRRSRARTGRSTSARPARCCERGTCATTSTAAARCCSAASPRARWPSPAACARPPAVAVHDAVRRRRPGQHAARPEHRQPDGAQALGRRGHRPARARASRSTPRWATTSTRCAASERIPIHGGPGTLGVFNAINVRGTPAGATPTSPHGSSFVQVVAASTARRCPDVAHDPHLLAVDRTRRRRTSPTRRGCSRASGGWTCASATRTSGPTRT